MVLARIIYGIQSDGLGHYARSKVVIDHLIKKGHDVKVLTGERVYPLMKGEYDVEKIAKISFVYKNNKVNYTRTIYRNFVEFPSIVRNGMRKTSKIFDRFAPDIVITDLEYFSTRTAAKRRVPIVCIDNIHSISRTDAPKHVARKYKVFETEQRSFLKILSPRSKHIRHYFIVSFFNPRPTRIKTTIIHPLIREEILEHEEVPEKDHILVYQTSKTNKRLFPALKEVDKEKFIIYGFDENREDGNLTFKTTDASGGFLKDLASAKAVIINGGFTLMSEAVYLKKPILSNPVSGQFEQIMNATMLEQEGFGMYTKRINADSIKLFLRNLDRYRSNLEMYEQQGNSEALKRIDMKIEEILNNG